MNSNMNKLVLSALTCTLLASLGGCGGGGADVAPASINSAQPAAGSINEAGKITLSLRDAAGASASVLARGKPLSASATVLDAQGKPVVNTLVSFSIDPALATMEPASGTVATDSAGKASITINAASLTSSGAGLLKVAAQVGDKALQSQSVLTVGASKLGLKLVTPESGAVQLAAYGSTVLTVDVSSDGAPLTSEAVAVNLASQCAADGKASLPSQVMSLNGRAQVVYRDLGCSQSDVITVSAAGVATPLAIKVAVSAPGAASIELASVVPADRSIVIKGAGGSGRTETAVVTFTVVDQFGKPLANQKVSFATISTKAVTLGRVDDTTDQNGQVSTTVNAGTEPTAVRVQATLASGLSSVSDTITVTTGVAVQSAFSLSAETYNMEGWDYDNVKNDLLLLLADQFGNPVADGTPVVFQTDSAAVGTSDRGGCTTVNGACTVPLRSQDPRFGTDASAPQGRAGLATVSVSSLSNTNTPLTGRLAIFLSGSQAHNISRIDASGVSTPVNGKISLNTSTCDSSSLRFRFSDGRFNPMPSGTTITGTGTDLSVVSILPGVVPVIAPQYFNGVVRGDQGSTHMVVLQPDSAKCVPTGSIKITGSVNINIVTPKGNSTVVTVDWTYPSEPPKPPKP